jgi:ornithine cyclodeaminase/alanine dehydrogenase-like protein (mu-crystallin family)
VRRGWSSWPRQSWGSRAPAAAVDADIVVTATWSRTSFLCSSMLPRRARTTLGGDEPGKAEIARDILMTATVVCDDIRLAAATVSWLVWGWVRAMPRVN